MRYKGISSPVTILLLWAVLFPVVVLGSVEPPADRAPSLSEMESFVMRLTDREFAGRGSGTMEVEAVADTLARRMKEAGLKPAFEGSWFQSFPLSGEGWAGDDLTGKTGRNVAGILHGVGDLSARYIVVGAHYDHLGRVDPAEPGGPSPEPGEYYAGANDNASGVAVLFELIRMAPRAGTETAGMGEGIRSILFVNFGSEEVGLQGSGFMASHPPVPLEKIDLMINLDTVGQVTDNRLYVSGVGTAEVLPGMAALANSVDFELSLAQGGWSGSDHMSFNTKEVPVLFIFGGPYPEYNTPADLGATLNYRGMGQVASYVDNLLNLARGETAEFDWIMVAGADLETGKGEGKNKNTWFGSMPDFTEDVQGYKLAGVFDGSPAAKAGLLKGDVLVKLGGLEVLDLPTFTQALRVNAPGDLVEVTVLRQGKPLNFTIVLGDRSQRK
ncbi:MAG: M28 family peptidase [Gemmatimonadales bacterium]|nr:M28 family peptidase [Gemmatimonadales bacterium]